MRQFEKAIYSSRHLEVHKTELLSLMVESLYFECTWDDKTWHWAIIKLQFTHASEVISIEEANKCNKNMTCKVQKMGELGFKYFLFILYFDLYAELPLTSKVVLYVDLKGKFLPNNGYSDTQLWILKLLPVLKLARVSHIHQAGLYLQLVVTILASFLPFFEVGGHMMSFYWWKLTAQYEFGQSTHNTGLCLCLFW